MTEGEVHTVQFANLAHHLEEQIRGQTEDATVNRYRRAMQAGEEFPPILVADVAGALVLVDGFHRRDAMESLSWTEGRAAIIPCKDLKEARWQGFKANLRHGQPLRPKLLRPALGAYVRAGHNQYANGRLRSYREMAKDLPGLSYQTIRRYIEKDFPALFRTMGGADGDAPGGLPDQLPPPTPEEEILAQARGYIAEARALLRGLPGEMRRLAADDVEVLRRELTWDEGDGGWPDLEAYTRGAT